MPPQCRPAEPTHISNPVAVFAGLDKITGRIINFDVYIDETVQFGALQVTPRVCYTRPPTEEPQTDAFVEVDEITLDRKIQRIFTGWMFADSPGLHAVDNAVYDVWLTDCKIDVGRAAARRAKNAVASVQPVEIGVLLDRLVEQALVVRRGRRRWRRTASGAAW